jgi:hypothetical protein
MAAKPQPFIRTGTVVLDAAGYGFVTITCPYNVRWQVGHQSVSTNIAPAVLLTTPAQPVVSIYQDTAPNAGAYIEGSYSGDRDSSDSTLEIVGGDSVTAEWNTPANGAADHAGLLATYVIRGLQFQEIPG